MASYIRDQFAQKTYAFLDAGLLDYMEPPAEVKAAAKKALKHCESKGNKLKLDAEELVQATQPIQVCYDNTS